MALRYWARNAQLKNRIDLRKVDYIMNEVYDNKETICTNLINLFIKVDKSFSDLDMSCEQAKEIAKIGVDFIYTE